MGALLSRIVLLANNTGRVVHLEERFCFALPGIDSYTIQLLPDDEQQIPATMFHQRVIDASRRAVIKIFLDDVDSNQALTPQDFIDYSRIIFSVDENGELIVTGVRATTLMEQFSRIRLVDFAIKGVHFLVGTDDCEDGQPERIE